jgi:hypothetical protein
MKKLDGYEVDSKENLDDYEIGDSGSVKLKRLEAAIEDRRKIIRWFLVILAIVFAFSMLLPERSAPFVGIIGVIVGYFGDILKRMYD